MSTTKTAACAVASDAVASDAVAIPGLDALDWSDLRCQLDEQSFAMTPRLLSIEECAEITAMFDPLPPIVQTLYTELCPPIVTIANDWLSGSDNARFRRSSSSDWREGA